MVLSSTDGAAGSTVRATLRGFGRLETIALTWGGNGLSEALGSVVASSTGSGSITVTLPAGAPAGDASITATGGSSGAVVTLPIAVTQAVAPSAEETATPEPTATPSPTPDATETPAETAEPTPTMAPTSTPVVPAAPTVTLVEVTSTEPTSVTLRVAATGADTVSVEFGLDTTYGGTATATPAGEGSFEVALEPLLPGTDYHYRVTATGAGGITTTADAMLTTGTAEG
jgi:hypothetical protein